MRWAVHHTFCEIRTNMYWNNDTVRQLDRASIRNFMVKHREYLKGRVLDFGAGKPGTCFQPEPYRDLVSGDYVPHEKGDSLLVGPFDVVMCNQVLQYLADPLEALQWFRSALCEGGHLVMTYATNWDEVEDADLWRFTKAGMERLLALAGFTVVLHERRAEIDLNGFRFPLGYGVVACR